MFYCKECQEGNKWPKTVSRSKGRCEVCYRVRYCYDGKIISSQKSRKKKIKIKSVLITKKHLAANIEIYSCPRCDESGIKLWMFFCPTCGIKIRWSKECKGEG